jgi:hypothetical protein
VIHSDDRIAPNARWRRSHGARRLELRTAFAPSTLHISRGGLMCFRNFTGGALLALALAACGRPEGKVSSRETWFVDDQLAGEFGAGTFGGSAWIPGQGLGLASGQSEGSFISRVMSPGRQVHYLQYRVVFASDALPEVPVLNLVRVVPAEE